MFRLIECNNPNLLGALVDKRRYNNKSDIDFMYRDGKKLCKWCNEKETPSHKHSYCSDKCKVSATIQMKPQCRAGLVYLLLRQRFKCAHCGYSWKEVFRDIYNHLKRHGGDDPHKHMTATMFGRFINGTHRDEKDSWLRHYKIRWHKGAQIDHRVPVWDNGETFGLDNLQALCVPCHSHKSARENKTRHAIKRNMKQ